MQFKKHFSSNLQNLSVKKTLIVQPPPSRNPNTPPSLNDSALSQTSSNKENVKVNHGDFENKKSDGRMSPLLTFNKIKRNTIGVTHQNQTQQHHRQIFTRNNTRPNLFRPHTDSNSLHQQQSNKNIRLGSMVFGSLVKREEASSSDAKGVRESRSIERMGAYPTQRDESLPLECANNDGEQAKYKVVSQGQGQELVCYCFNCAILLVKQGFSIEELTPQDRNSLKMRQSHGMSRSAFHSRPELSASRLSAARGLQSERVKVGEQVKCRIIMRLNKLRVAREEFNKTIETHVENIDYFYSSIAAFIEQQRVADRQEILRMRGIRKGEPENYESQLSSALGTIDYMMKNLQGVNYEFLTEVEALLQHEVTYPKMRINMEPFECFQAKIDQFSTYFERNLKISLQEEANRSRMSSQTDQINMPRNHPLRFSFEEALQQLPRGRTHFYQGEPSMNPLEEENQSELEDSLPIVERRQNAFRNLFPEDDFSDSDMDRPKQSPVFKQF